MQTDRQTEGYLKVGGIWSHIIFRQILLGFCIMPYLEEPQRGSSSPRTASVHSNFWSATSEPQISGHILFEICWGTSTIIFLS